ncbi:MAG: FtsQ-type POTRA domain-containing protein [Legionella sp.]|uniref:cell division protein FtsQ/DivIB n=1 Tax=Legionella sp. TaxID=459 RepID=UPI0039E4A25F
MIERRDNRSEKVRYGFTLWVLILVAILLAGRLAYWYLSDVEYFPIATIKVAASYEHVSHKDLEGVLAKYVGDSFFMLPVKKLQKELNAMPWVDMTTVERVWPDTLKIKLVEKKPIAIWGNALMTAGGQLFSEGDIPTSINIPRLKGPLSQQREVLQVYEKLSKILSMYGLNATGLHLRDNQSWVLLIDNEVKIYLGKKELEARLLRFCKAYPAIFAQKADQLASVDLRYPRGMAVQWKQQTER